MRHGRSSACGATPAPILAPIADVQRDMLVVTLAAALVAGAILYLAFRSAQSRISRQTEQLLDATERDPLTGLLNHGALVVQLGTALERARADGTPIGIALVDVDNFRLLNETHGHDAGDDVLQRVVATLRSRLDGTTVLGRYGPDEFLVIAPAAAIAALDRVSSTSATRCRRAPPARSLGAPADDDQRRHRDLSERRRFA